MNGPENRQTTGATAEGGIRALVVEDNPTNQAVIRAILKSLDIDMRVAVDGAKAVEAVRVEQFDVILMDINMPVMDGFQAAREIRNLGGWCASVPIIAVTANEMANDRKACVDAGLDDVIPKPIDTRVFAETILRHLSTSAD